MINGIFYGIFIAIVFYYLVQTILLNSKSVFWFTCYTACVGLVFCAFQGDLEKFLQPIFLSSYHTILISLIGLLYFCGTKFFRTFLNVKFYSISIDKLLRIFQWIGILFIPVNLLPSTLTLIVNFILFWVGPLVSIVILIFNIYGILNNRFFTVGWIISHIAMATGLLYFFDIISWVSGYPYLLPLEFISSIIIMSIPVIEESRHSYKYALQDNLTGIATRRLFDQALAIEWNRCLRDLKPISVIIADIDDFRAFNELYGSEMGDECLKRISQLFDKHLKRAADMTARYGGEEFIAMLPDTITSEANFLAEKLRESVEKLSIKHEQSNSGKIVTISLGTATLIPDAKKSPAQIILDAGKALYQAKNNGRNRVISKHEENI